VLPSLPGYGFSSEPTEGGWNPARIARAWAELMRRPGYTGHAAADDRLCLLDSPVALAAWMLDHDTDSYQKIPRAFLGEPELFSTEVRAAFQPLR
jgi:hypothetical protein